MRYLWFFLALAAFAQDISGIVVDELSGLPIASAMVRLYPDGGMPGGRLPPRWMSATTGTDGKFVVPQATAGKYTIACSKLGYLTEENMRQRGPAVEVKADGTVFPSQVRIRLMPGAVLSGRVVTKDGKAIADANVKQEFGDGSQTNQAGEFELTGLRSCEKDCKLRIEIGEQARGGLSVKNAATKQTFGPPDWVDHPVSPWLAGQHVRNLEIRLPFEPLVTFSGVVLNPPENAEVKLARKGLGDYAAVGKPLESGGKFRFDLIPVGDYRLLVGERMQFQTPPLEVAIRIGGDLLNQQITLPKPLSVSGVVKLNGKPHCLPGMSVSLQLQGDRNYRSARGEVRQDGSFEVSGLSPGKWNAGIGFTFMRRNVEPVPKMNVRSRGFTLVEIVSGENPPPIVLELVETVNVRGRILDAQGLPVPGSVIFKNAGDTQFFPSDRFGNFGSGLVPGSYEVTAWKAGDTVDHRSLPACPSARTMNIKADLLQFDVHICR